MLTNFQMKRIQSLKYKLCCQNLTWQFTYFFRMQYIPYDDERQALVTLVRSIQIQNNLLIVSLFCTHS
jgi:hypothetical protein